MGLSEKVTFQSEILELGSHNNLAQHDLCPIFSSKITPPYPTPFAPIFIIRLEREGTEVLLKATVWRIVH